MCKSILIPLIIIIWYCASPLYFIIAFILLYTYFYNYILTFANFSDTSLLVTFLNKLNNSTLNPLIFLIILGLVKSYYYYNYSIANYRYLILICIITLPSYIETTIPNYINSCILLPTFAATLTNGLLIIHPLILYTFYSLLLSLTVGYYYTLKFNPVKLTLFYPYLRITNVFYIFGSIALFLGAWWSHQELNWGGFWSWDLVEVFLLITVTYSILIRHYYVYSIRSLATNIFFIVNFFAYIVSVRYNLINSIHNFIAQSNFLYKITYVLLILIMVSTYLYLKFIYALQNNKPNNQYLYPIIILESLYVILIVYVSLTYVGFYLMSTSSTIFINIVPILIYSIWLSMFITKCTAMCTYLPFIEALLVSSLLKININATKLNMLHVCILFFFMKLTVWYNFILLFPLGNVINFITTLSLNSTSLLDTNVTGFSNYINKHQAYSFTNFYVDSSIPNNLLQTAYTSVIYPTTFCENGYSSVIFAHKFFAKISLVEVFSLLIVLFFVAWYFTLYKRLEVKF